jgi:coenzyme F420-reducing hydrogenase delta subunit
MTDFAPEITAFCCRFCAYAAADLAGSMRLRYPPNLKIVFLPCTGKVDALHILKAFESGADGVLVAGCREGDCHFLTGNLRAKRRVRQVQQLLDEVGLGGARLAMFNLSSAMGGRFAEIAREMTQKIRELGPSPIGRAARENREEPEKHGEDAGTANPGERANRSGARP